MADDEKSDTDLYDRARELATVAKTAQDYYAVLELLHKANKLNPTRKYAKRIAQLEQIIHEAKNASTSESEDEFHDSNHSTHSTDQSSRSEDSPIGATAATSVAAKFENEANHLAESIAAVTLSDDSTSSRFVDIKGIRVRREIYDRLYAYQVEGLHWLIDLFEKDTQYKGGVLADDMGLGKTIQSIVFISTLMENKVLETALIIAPSTLLNNWAREFKKWFPSVDLYEYHEGTPRQRLLQLEACQRNGGVLFTTYGLLHNHVDQLSKYRHDDFIWDACILDEAHTIKNPNKTSAAANYIPAKFRLAISGTPLQNRLSELWAIYNWVFKGTLLGGYQNFKIRYELPITSARGKNATSNVREQGTRLAESLRQIYKPFFLRRTKDEVLSICRSPSSGKSAALPPKTDLIVWITLGSHQASVYQDILKSKDVKQAFVAKNRALVVLNCLKKLCDSLLLLPLTTVNRLNKRSRNLNHSNGADDTNVLEELFNETDKKKLVDISTLDVDFILENTSKLRFLLKLIALHKEEGHRTLIFSQSLRMLDIIERILTLEGHQLARIDGAVKTKDREVIIERFRQKSEINVFLLTTGVGGVGLTLTEADRVVIYDPSWNPATDAQAIDRAYRIGQSKPVTVYRLITVSTVEEKIFRRQVFKNSVIKQMVHSERDPMRYFTDNDIRELFKFGNPNVCETFLQLYEIHGDQIANLPTSDLENLLKIESCYNVTDHNLLFSEEEKNTRGSFDQQDIEQVVANAKHNLLTDAKSHQTNGRNEYKDNKVNWNPLAMAVIPTRKAAEPIRSFPTSHPVHPPLRLLSRPHLHPRSSSPPSAATSHSQLVPNATRLPTATGNSNAIEVVQIDDEDEDETKEKGKQDDEDEHEDDDDNDVFEITASSKPDESSSSVLIDSESE